MQRFAAMAVALGCASGLAACGGSDGAMSAAPRRTGLSCEQMISSDALARVTNQSSVAVQRAHYDRDADQSVCSWSPPVGFYDVEIRVWPVEDYELSKKLFKTDAGADDDDLGQRSWSNPDRLYMAYFVGFVTSDGAHAVIVDVAGFAEDQTMAAGNEQPVTPDVARAIAEEVDDTLSAK